MIVQAAVAERDGAVDVVSFVVGAAMAQRGRHAADDGAVGAPLIQRDEAAKAAHGRAGWRRGPFPRITSAREWPGHGSENREARDAKF